MRKIILMTILLTITLASTIILINTQNIGKNINIESTKEVIEIQPRPWITTAKQIEDHENYVRFMAHEVQDNYYNIEQRDASILAYNIETQIGKEVDAYELAALYAKLQIMNNTYNPTSPERKMHEWAFVLYDLPEKKSEIRARISNITNSADMQTIDKLLSATNRLINIGAVSNDLSKIDQNYWFSLSIKATCEHDPDCDLSMLGFDEFNEPQTVSTIDYGFHHTYTRINYLLCHGPIRQCYHMDWRMGTGLLTNIFNSPEHVYSNMIQLELHNTGTAGYTNIIVGQIIGPVSGSSLSARGTTEHVSTFGYLMNPNARSQSYVEIQITSNSYRLS